MKQKILLICIALTHSQHKASYTTLHRKDHLLKKPSHEEFLRSRFNKYWNNPKREYTLSLSTPGSCSLCREGNKSCPSCIERNKYLLSSERYKQILEPIIQQTKFPDYKSITIQSRPFGEDKLLKYAFLRITTTNKNKETITIHYQLTEQRVSKPFFTETPAQTFGYLNKNDQPYITGLGSLNSDITNNSLIEIYNMVMASTDLSDSEKHKIANIVIGRSEGIITFEAPVKLTIE